MPIKIPDQLPARDTLINEGIMVMAEAEAVRQDIRPMKIGLLNLMPNKIQTETQIARLIAATALQVELTLVRAASHESKTTSAEHLAAFYRTWEEVEAEKFDAFVVTGAPVGMVPYEEITYWDELKRIFDWTTSNVHSSLFVCWGAMAALYHFHGLSKVRLAEKAFGVFPHSNCRPGSPFLVGFSDSIQVPVSRWTTMQRHDVEDVPSLRMLLDSPETGPCLIHEPHGGRLYMINHLEYDATTLRDEYLRDRRENPDTPLPKNYFPFDDPGLMPPNRWRAHAHLFIGNWINQTYQTTPFELERIGEGR
ncbi:homoserine O-succinyltransferase [Parvularcula marina]|uniref:Homoserine O-succinyltransferase n=1 Tax=Parvularcula marina TaxID=2292771 RepID=A0A371RFT0_9PROT|nr:homoserine O-succinyltransferase [Parvularcula marina]RFB04290.1 homoserine O-succinyltransferase [Parvularcula marina]